MTWLKPIKIFHPRAGCSRNHDFDVKTKAIPEHLLVAAAGEFEPGLAIGIRFYLKGGQSLFFIVFMYDNSLAGEAVEQAVEESVHEDLEQDEEISESVPPKRSKKTGKSLDKAPSVRVAG